MFNCKFHILRHMLYACDPHDVTKTRHFVNPNEMHIREKKTQLLIFNTDRYIYCFHLIRKFLQNQNCAFILFVQSFVLRPRHLTLIKYTVKWRGFKLDDCKSWVSLNHHIFVFSWFDFRINFCWNSIGFVLSALI